MLKALFIVLAERVGFEPTQTPLRFEVCKNIK
jgi:hypothetical protein